MFDELDKALIHEVQGDIPLSLDPYGDLAVKLGCSKEEVMNRLRGYSEKGLLKRIGAILHHRDSGYNMNGMFVCIVPKDRIEEAGSKLASLPQVSHCYERTVYPDWPYNLYGMIHGRSKEDVEQIVQKFVQEMNIETYTVLFSIEEFKKSSMKFF